MSNRSALDVQVGGDHYKKLKIQPIEYTMKNGLDFIQGNIIKYATRFKDKNGPQDLEKVKHYADLAIESFYPDYAMMKAQSIKIDTSTERGSTVMRIAEALMQLKDVYGIKELRDEADYLEKKIIHEKEKKMSFRTESGHHFQD